MALLYCLMVVPPTGRALVQLQKSQKPRTPTEQLVYDIIVGCGPLPCCYFATLRRKGRQPLRGGHLRRAPLPKVAIFGRPQWGGARARTVARTVAHAGIVASGAPGSYSVQCGLRKPLWLRFEAPVAWTASNVVQSNDSSHAFYYPNSAVPRLTSGSPGASAMWSEEAASGYSLRRLWLG